jgi:hypothetical protein
MGSGAKFCESQTDKGISSESSPVQIGELAPIGKAECNAKAKGYTKLSTPPPALKGKDCDSEKRQSKAGEVIGAVVAGTATGVASVMTGVSPYVAFYAGAVASSAVAGVVAGTVVTLGIAVAGAAIGYGIVYGARKLLK